MITTATSNTATLTVTSIAAYTVWYNVVRPIAVGTMLVGAASTMFSMRASLASSLRGIFTASTKAAHEGKLLDRTERDIPARWVVLAMLLALHAALLAAPGSEFQRVWLLVHFGLFLLCSLYLQNVLGWGPLTTGLAFIPLALAAGERDRPAA